MAVMLQRTPYPQLMAHYSIFCNIKIRPEPILFALSNFLRLPGAIESDVAQFRLIVALKNCHFDRREKSALHRFTTTADFSLRSK
jgi:hypothetical protein